MEKNRRRIIMYYARPPDHQQPSRRGARIPARPDTGTSLAPGFPTHLLTPVIRTPPIHLFAPSFPWPAIMVPGAGGCVRRRVSLRTPAPAPGMHAWPIMYLWGKQVGLQEHASAGCGNPGPRTCPWHGGHVVRAARPGWRLMFGGSC